MAVRAGDRIRFIPIVVVGTLAPGLLLALMAGLTGAIPVWWSIPFGLACGALAAWASLTFFGVAQIERLAAAAAHGGRHYYFEQQEIQVRFDEAGGAWLRLADIRRCVGGDTHGIRHYASTEACLVDGEGRAIYLSIGGVRRYVRLVRHADKRAFLLWFERDFVVPIERRRERNLPLHSTGGGRI